MRAEQRARQTNYVDHDGPIHDLTGPPLTLSEAEPPLPVSEAERCSLTHFSSRMTESATEAACNSGGSTPKLYVSTTSGISESMVFSISDNSGCVVVQSPSFAANTGTWKCTRHSSMD